MQQWEYLVVSTCGEDWVDSEGRKGRFSKSKPIGFDWFNDGPLLASLGSQGWELVAKTREKMWGVSGEYYGLYFKRPKP